MGLLRRVAGRLAARAGRSTDRQASAPSAARSARTPAPLGNAVALAHIDCGAQELKERLDAGETVVIVDVRDDVTAASLVGARRLPLAQLDGRWSELADADEIVCVCADGRRSLQAARLLRERGLINATRMDDGLLGWAAVGGDLVPSRDAGDQS